MADLEKFPLQVNFRAPGTPDVSTGAPQMWASLAQRSASLAATLGEMADKAAIYEGHQAGLAYGGDAALPGVDVAPGAAPAAGAAPASDKPMGMSFTGPPPKPGSAADAIRLSAQQLGIDPVDLATAISYETGGRFSPSIKGGKGGRYLGLIQFGPEEQRKYGVRPGQGFGEQMQAVTAFLKDRGVKPGMGMLDIYSTINAGSPGRYGASDGPGKTVRSHVAEMMGAHRAKAAAFLGGKSGVPVPAGAPASGMAGAVAPPAIPSPASVTVTPAAQPFTLNRGWTLRGQAFDAAARGVYADRLETKALGDMATIAAATPDDPAATAAALDDYRKKTRGELTPELRPAFDNLLTRHTLSYTQAASREHAKKLADEANAAFLTNYEAKRTALIRMAGTAGFDDAGNAALAAELQGMHDYVAGTAGLTAKERFSLERDLTDDVMTARVIAGFEGRKTPEARAAYADAFDAAWKDGKGEAKDMSPEAYGRVQAQLRAALNADTAALHKRSAEIGKGLESALGRVKDGYAIPEDERTALKAGVAAVGDPALTQKLGFMDSLINWQTVYRGLPPEMAAAAIREAEKTLNEKGATPEGVAALETMRGFHKTMVDQLSKDPLGFAEKAGVMAVPPLDMNNLGASLKARAVAAEAVARTYRVTPQYFRPAERELFAKEAANNPDMLASFGPALVEALGSAAPKALAEISKDAPVLAHVSGLAMATGDDRFLRETSEALKLRMVDGHVAVKAPAELRRTLPALMALPSTEAAAVQTAELVFDLRARAMGLDPAKDAAGAAELWTDTLSQALGAHEVNGETLGGLGEVNGSQVLLPPDMSAEKMQDAFDRLTDVDLSFLPPFGSMNGIEIDADRIGNGKPVAVGPYTYRLALGDPGSRDPAYVMTPGGDYWTFDVRDLARERSGGGWK